MFLDEAVESSYQPYLMRSSYIFLTVLMKSRRMKYGGDSGSSDDWDMSSDWFDDFEGANFIIFDTGSGIFLMVPQSGKY